MLSSMRCVVHLSTRTLMPFAGIRRGADEENMLRCRGALRCMSQLIPPIIREFTVGFSEACRHTMHAAERVLCRFNLKRLMREKIRGHHYTSRTCSTGQQRWCKALRLQTTRCYAMHLSCAQCPILTVGLL